MTDTTRLAGLVTLAKDGPVYRGAGTVFRWPLRFELRRGPDERLTLAIINDGADIGPSVLIDGWGHEDEAPKARDDRPVTRRAVPPSGHKRDLLE